MSKKVDYTILSSNFAHELEELVIGYIANCWEPLGGVAAICVDQDVKYLQAMVRYEEPVTYKINYGDRIAVGNNCIYTPPQG